jgi:hypothetical protein
MSITHDIHDGKGGKKRVKTTPPKAIRLCMGYQQAEIVRCSAPLCPLFPYKMGKSNVSLSDMERKVRSERMKKRHTLHSPQAKVVQESTISSGLVG